MVSVAQREQMASFRSQKYSKKAAIIINDSIDGTGDNAEMHPKKGTLIR
jgi:hypothetical protein